MSVLSPLGSRIAVASFAIGVGACSTHAPPDLDGSTSRTSSAIVGGSASPSTDDAVVLLAWLAPGTEKIGICTATLLAPRLILTARHCVSETDLDVACTSEGTAVLGGDITKNHSPADLYVFTGKDRPRLQPPLAPAAKVARIIDDGAKNLCNHDLALALLDKPLDGVPVASIRLDGTVAPGELLTAVGWGVTSEQLEPTTRQRRSGVAVTRVGPDTASPVLTPNEILFGESICLGDSGGPIFSERSGAIVGVVSRGGNGTASELNPASMCARATNLATKIAPFKPLIMDAYTRAGAEPRIETPPEEDDGGGCTMVKTAHRRPATVVFATVAVASAALRRLRRRWRQTSPASLRGER